MHWFSEVLFAEAFVHVSKCLRGVTLRLIYVELRQFQAALALIYINYVSPRPHRLCEAEKRKNGPKVEPLCDLHTRLEAEMDAKGHIHLATGLGRFYSICVPIPGIYLQELGAPCCLGGFPFLTLSYCLLSRQLACSIARLVACFPACPLAS